MNTARLLRSKLTMRVHARHAALVVAAIALAAAALPVHANVGARPANFTLSAVPGGPTRGRFTLRDHLGRDPIVILFWATWCTPCRQELPVYERLWQQHHEHGLVVVAISMDDANAIAGAGSTARRLGLHFPVLGDLDTRVTSRLNPRRAAPFSVWIDRTGHIVREKEGFALADRAEIARGIAALVAAN